jgi:nicotinamidase-related amidase
MRAAPPTSSGPRPSSRSSAGWSRRRGITRLYITGLHTDCCARHTSGDAFQRGYDLVWISDALQAFTEEAHQAGLEYFRAWYASDAEGQIRTTDQVVEEWAAVPA